MSIVPEGKNRHRGIFITFEGGDGCGKTTQIQRLSHILADRQILHIVTREPGGTVQAEKLRQLLVQGETAEWDGVEEALLMAAARRNHLRHLIWPALKKGMWILSDRFADSTFAYQGYGQQLGEGFVSTLNTLTMGAFQPDLTFIFQFPFHRGVERKKEDQTCEDRFEKYAPSFHERVQEGYNTLLAHDPERCVSIPADISIEAITQMLVEALEKKVYGFPNKIAGDHSVL